MIFPLHHVPGCLRIKNMLARGNARAAEIFRARVLSIAGVESVEITIATGYAVIRYSRETVTGLGILMQLDRLLYAGILGVPESAASA